MTRREMLRAFAAGLPFLPAIALGLTSYERVLASSGSKSTEPTGSPTPGPESFYGRLLAEEIEETRASMCASWNRGDPSVTAIDPATGIEIARTPAELGSDLQS